jgi:predicted amidohydrolase
MFLSAVQTKVEPEAYGNEAAFGAWILEQTRAALHDRDPSEPALVAFPELIGLPLLFYLNRKTSVRTVQDAALELLRSDWQGALRFGVQHRYLSISNLILPRAVQMHRTLCQAFSSAAQRFDTFIVGGSSFLPLIDHEAARGEHIANPRVQNVSYLFAPTGRLLHRSAKLNLTGGVESSLGLTRAQLVASSRTPLGEVATLICFDAFFDSLVARADALGASVLVQPSANAAPWRGPWSADATLLEGEQWLARGLPRLIQHRTNLRYGLNPMLVGKLFDLRFEGCSSISANTSLTGHAEPIIASASQPDQFEIVSARVD